MAKRSRATRSSKRRDRTPSSKERLSTFKWRVNRLFSKMPGRPRKIKRPKEPTWTTKTGEVIPVSKLTDDHLRNIIGFLVGQAPRRQMLHVVGALNYALHAPDGASRAAEDEAEAVQDLTSDEYARMRYPAVFAEQDKRLKRLKCPLKHSLDFGVQEINEWYL